MNDVACDVDYIRNRERTSELFSTIAPEAYLESPIPLRHPFVFYHGHLPAFSFLTLNRAVCGERPIDETLEELFRRGIDPESRAKANELSIERWPDRATIERFIDECDRRVLAVLKTNERSNRLATYTILEHEAMHHETLTYIIHQLSYRKKRPLRFSHRDGPVPQSEPLAVARGIALLGVPDDDEHFSWDNERGALEIKVDDFSIDRFNVTNGEWLDFVDAGGPVPIFWEHTDRQWRLRACFETISLPLSWPVYVTLDQAQAFARWKGLRLPTEAEYHRAAFGTPWGETRRYPWGEDSPSARHGNFDFRRYDPEPVFATPAGASAWGVESLFGNGWEWTTTPFAPFPGFTPQATYPQYSVDFFDGRHFVLKGASPVTPRRLLRASFRNWFYPDYPYLYASFRCVR